MSRIASSFVATQAPNRSWPRRLGLILLGTLVLTASSHVSVPMWPVPATMQTLAVLMVGALYGWRLGGITILTWLFQGALGLPVFADGTGGLAHFMGPTAGYLLAFPVAGALVGWLVAHGCGGIRPLRAFGVMLLGATLCLLLGTTWLAAAVGWDRAWTLGFAPFLVGEAVKSALGAATLVLWETGRQRLQRRQ